MALKTCYFILAGSSFHTISIPFGLSTCHFFISQFLSSTIVTFSHGMTLLDGHGISPHSNFLRLQTRALYFDLRPLDLHINISPSTTIPPHRQILGYRNSCNTVISTSVHLQPHTYTHLFLSPIPPLKFLPSYLPQSQSLPSNSRARHGLVPNTNHDLGLRDRGFDSQHHHSKCHRITEILESRT
jgi:hypothetical protein